LREASGWLQFLKTVPLFRLCRGGVLLLQLLWWDVAVVNRLMPIWLTVSVGFRHFGTTTIYPMAVAFA
jgi:hypothetical protein